MPALRRISSTASHPTPALAGTGLLLAAIIATAVTARGESPSQLASYAARGVGIGLGACVFIEIRKDWRQLFRADLMALFALYFLTFFEFLYPQPRFDSMVDDDTTLAGLNACYLGFAGLALGRHWVWGGSRSLMNILRSPVPSALVIRCFWVFIVIGFAYMLQTSSFSPLEMIHHMLEPRFSQPWGRGKLGDWKALLFELSMLLYLVPPLAGVVLARRHKYSSIQIGIAVTGLLSVLFYGFSSGTRNIFSTYLVTCLAGYIFALPRAKRKEPIIIALLGSALLIGSTRVMLQFRTIGLRNYLAGSRSLSDEDEFFVDYNLWVIGILAKSFPEQYPYLGLEIPYQSLIRPIPRVLWPSKPEGLSVSIEEVVGVEGLTLACTFIGEAWISGGLLGVFVAGCLFGAAARWWGALARADSSDFGILIYASGFFAIVISMRSLLVSTTAALPTLAAIALGALFLKRATLRSQLQRRPNSNWMKGEATSRVSANPASRCP